MQKPRVLQMLENNSIPCTDSKFPIQFNCKSELKEESPTATRRLPDSINGNR